MKRNIYKDRKISGGCKKSSFADSKKNSGNPTKKV